MMIVGPVGTVKKPSVVGEAFSSHGGNPRSLRISIVASVSTGLLLFCYVASSLAALFLMERSAETIRLRARLDDVCLVGQSVQHRLAQPGVWEHARPL